MANPWVKFSLIVLGVCSFNLYSVGQVEHPEPMDLSRAVTPDAFATGPGQAKEEARDPFWPVGYEPPKPSVSQQQETETTVAEGTPLEEVDDQPVDFSGLSPEEQQAIKERMNVGGILRQNQTMIAIINNQLLKEGETLRLDNGKRTYRFRVKQLTMERIKLETIAD